MMPVTISVGSGKGGTGKTLVASNIAAILSQRGKEVYLIDLDLGGADAHILYGVFKPSATLTDFLTGSHKYLHEVSIRLDTFYGLNLIVGTGETLKTANMPYATKKRLLKHIKMLKGDVVILDVGAGTSLNTLDFFISTDIQLCVSTLDPTSILDFYRFLKLSTIRKVLSSFLSTDEISRALSQKDFQRIDEIFAFAEKIRPDARKKAENSLNGFRPALILNQVRGESTLDRLKLKHVVSKFLGITLPELGVIPWDEMVFEAVRSYMPIIEYSPGSKAAVALVKIVDSLLKMIDTQIA